MNEHGGRAVPGVASGCSNCLLAAGGVVSSGAERVDGRHFCPDAEKMRDCFQEEGRISPPIGVIDLHLRYRAVSASSAPCVPHS